MIRKLIYLLFFIFCAYSTKAQSYFNNRYEIFGRWDVASSIITTDTNYFVASFVTDSNNFFRSCLQSLDTVGNILFTKTIGKPNWYFKPGSSSSMILSRDTTLVLSGTVYDAGTTYLVNLIKYNLEGDTIWTKQFGDSIQYYSGFQCKQTTDGGFIIAGAMDNGSSTQALLIKTDSLGNLQWEQNYGGPGEEYGFTVQLSPDGGFLVGGSTTSIGAGDVDAWVFKTDSLGNLQWQRTYGNSFEDCPAYLGKTIGNYYVFCGCQRYNAADGKPRIVKLDLNGNTIWDTLYFNASNSTALHSIKELAGGGFIAVGTKGNNLNKLEGLVMKINPNGSLIWKRTPVKLTGINSPNVLYDFDVSPSNYIVSTGFVSPMLPDTGSQDIWVIKLDEWGCDTLNCQYTGIEDVAKENNSEFLIFPNPSSGQITLSYKMEDKYSQCMFEVYDLTGRILFSIPLQQSEGQITKDFGEVSDGLYFYSITSEMKTIHSGKIIIAK